MMSNANVAHPTAGRTFYRAQVWRRQLILVGLTLALLLSLRSEERRVGKECER